MKPTIPAAAALVLALAACNDTPASDAGDGRTAEGEVLGGTISDEMLPLDTVTSQSPPLRAEPSGDPSDSAEDEAADEPADEAAAQATPAPPPEAAAPAPDGDDSE